MNRVSALVLVALWASVAMPVRAQVAVTETWDDFAIVSSTMGANLGRLCAGADRGDLGCPTYAPSLTTAGDVSVTGNLSAVKFIGDGSGLTGLSATGDRIVSGTSSIIVSNSGHISFTTAGTERMVINSSGNVGIGTKAPGTRLEIKQSADTSTGGLRVTNSSGNRATYLWSDGSNNGRLDSGATGTGIFVLNSGGGNVGIGTTSPQTTLQVSGSFIVSTSAQTTTPSLYVGTNGNVGIGTSAPSATLQVNGSSGLRISHPSAAADYYTEFVQNYSGTEPFYILTKNYGRPLGVKKFGTMTGAQTYASGYYGLGFATGSTNPAKTDLRMFIDSSGNVGIGTTSPGQTLDVSGTARIVSRTMIGGTATPSATLQVSGSLLLAGSDSTTCDDTHLGILRRNPTTGRLQVCK